MPDTLREYLIKLGFVVDQNGWKGFNDKIAQSSRNVLRLGADTVAVATEIGVAVDRVARSYEELYYVSQRTGGSVGGLKAQAFGFGQIGSSAEAARVNVENFAASVRTNPGVRALFENMGINTSDSQKAIGQLVDRMKTQFGEGGYFVAQRYAAMGGIDETTFRQIWMNREKLRQQEEGSLKRQKEAGIDGEKYARDSVKFGDSLRTLQDRWSILIDRVAIGWLPTAQKAVEIGDSLVGMFTRADVATEGWLGKLASVVAALGALKVAGAALGAAGRLVGLGGGGAAAGAAARGMGLRGRLLRGGGVGGMALSAAGAMKYDSQNGNSARTWLRAQLGISDPGEAAPWRGAVASNMKSAVDFFVAKGWTREQAAGIVANLHGESGLNPMAIGDGGSAYGAAQWHPDRQADFQRWSGKSIRGSSLEEQMAFVHHELTEGKEKLAGNALRGTKTAREAGSTVSRMYERPADVLGAASNRGAMADTILSSQGGGANVTISHKTENNITGVSDPKKAASLIDESQSRTNGNIVRNTRSLFN